MTNKTMWYVTDLIGKHKYGKNNHQPTSGFQENGQIVISYKYPQRNLHVTPDFSCL